MQQQDRLHALDAVRAFALLLGIAYHATMSFIPTLAANGWPIVDNSPSDTLSATFYVLHIFRMTTFFVIAGFFARLAVYRKGVSGFIKDRRKRILVPLLISWPVQMALMLPAFLWAMSKAGRTVAPPASMNSGEHVMLPFVWAHLWFLYVLILLYAFLLGARWLGNTVVDRAGRMRSIADSGIAFLMRNSLAPVLLAIPVGVSLYATEWWNFWKGIPTPDNSFIPNLASFAGYSTAVLFGWFLHRQSELLRTIQKFWLVNLAAAITLTVLCYSMVGMPTMPVNLSATARAVYSAAYSVAVWTGTFAAIGAALRFFANESSVRRYLADASYWMYIMHLPVLSALAALMMQWPLHWSIKYSLILSITSALLLISYHYWVRPTRIGEMLNGRRYPRNAKPSPLLLTQ